MRVFKIESNMRLPLNEKITFKSASHDLFILLKSKCRVITQDDSFLVSPDSVLIMPAGKTAEVESTGNMVLIDWFEFRDQVYPAKYGKTFFKEINCIEISRIINRMKGEELSGRLNYQEIINLCASEACLVLDREEYERPTRSFTHSFYRLRENFENQPYKEWNIDEIIAESGLSRRQFYFTYNALFNSSPKKDIMNIRIEYAKYLLLVTDERTSQVAERCCFKSDQHFIQTFKKKTGVTPADFRRKWIRIPITDKRVPELKKYTDYMSEDELK